jgi:GH15 family glucan-1,4-alpha-glucosidase
MIGDCHTVALVSKHGSIDWLCLPHFDSPACFAALLGTAENGHWSISPVEPIRAIRRRYRDGSLILETEFETESGSATLIDCMIIREEMPELLRVVVGTRGQIRMKLELVVRFDYGSVVPWVRRTETGISAIAGPDMIRLRAEAPLHGENMKTEGEFTVAEGQIIAAPTTSLPELIGGVRNWDYRFCWVRDATLTLQSLLHAGYLDEARDWREWLLRAVAGSPSQLNILYGLRGERRLTELELPWLPGYEKSAPVRTGNGAYQQYQLEIFGEVANTLFLAREAGLGPARHARHEIASAMLEFLETGWERPDEGIWEVRGPRRHFVHSKMMAWVAVDRLIRSAELGRFTSEIARWKKLRDAIHEQVCRQGFNGDLNSFVQYYGSKHLDASILNDAPGWLSCRGRSARSRHGQSHRKTSPSQWLCRTVSTRSSGRRHAPWRRGVSGVLILVGRQLPVTGSPPRRSADVRTSVRNPERCRPSGRRI